MSAGHIHHLTPVVDSYFPEPHAGLLNGILLGDELSKSTAFYEAVHHTGLLHLVVLSGMNVTLLVQLIAMLASGFGRRISLYVSIGGICIFVWFVGIDAPIVRAACMGVITLLGAVTGRKTYALFVLGTTVVCLLAIKPEWLTSVSFQLSSLATLGMILWGGSGNLPAPDASKTRKIGGYILGELRSSCAAQILTMPIIFWHFGELSLIAPIANLLVSPVVAPLMLFGFMTVLLGKVHSALGYVPSFVCFGLLDYMVRVIEIIAHMPYIFFALKASRG